MTDPIDIEPILDDWLGVGSDILPDRSVDAVLRTVRQTTQRGAWRAPWRTTYMHNIPRLAVAGAALVAVLAVGGLLLRGSPSATGGAGHGPVRSAPPTPSGTPAPSAASAAPAYETPLGMAIVGIDGTLRQDLGLPSDAWGPDLSADGDRVFLLTRSKDVVHCFGCANPGAWPAVVPVGKTSGLYICCDTDGFGQAAWSPDGSQLAYQHTGKDGNVDVYVVPVVDDGSGIVRKRRQAPHDRPGRRWLAGVVAGRQDHLLHERRCHGGGSSGFSETQEIWRVPATGGTPQRLTDNAVADLQPDVAADGTVVYWEGDEIWTMAADGTKQHRLAAIPSDIGFNPRWSPDGSKIAVLQYDASKRALFDPAIRQDADLALLRVVVVDVATGDTTTVGPRVASFFNPVSWTPDGTALLINRYDDGPWDQPDLCGRERGQKDCVGRPDGRRRRSTMRRTSRMRSVWSGREDLNLRPHRPERCALPSCATPRPRVPVVTGPADDSAS